MLNQLTSKFTKTAFTSDILNLMPFFVLWISTAIIVISIIYKFIEYGKLKGSRKIEHKKTHLVETSSMTFVAVIIYNLLQHETGAVSVSAADRIISLIYGGSVVIYSVYLHVQAKIVIGKQWSNQIEIIEGHKLLTTGPYAVARHPMYSSLILWLAALCLIFFNYAAFIVLALVFIPILLLRSRAEDRFLKEIDETAFAVYSRTVSALIPGIKNSFSVFLRVIVIAALGYTLFEGRMDSTRLFILFAIHFTAGLLTGIPKIRFSYINKSFIMVLLFAVYMFYKPAFFLLGVIFFFDIWGLFANCPCMFVYERYSGCPCFGLLKSCIIRPKKQ